MPTKRKNKAPRDTTRNLETSWFKANRERQRKRSKLAKNSRKKNRGK